jgi:hypothetical protein
MRSHVLVILLSFMTWRAYGQSAEKATLSFPLPRFLDTRQLMAQKPVAFTAEMERQIRQHYGCSSCGSFHGVGVPLGILGYGVLLTDTGDCGATGNCPMAVMFRYSGHYRIADLDSAWTYALVPRRNSVPDIVIMANMSAAVGEATRYRFEGGTYVKFDSEETPFPP